MTPSAYVETYLGFYAWVGDSFVPVWVRQYLQSGLGNQSNNAKVAYDKLTRALASRLKCGTLPATFEIDGDRYVSNSLWRVYNGKGAPDEFQSALWLASLCGLVDEGSVDTYMDRCFGIDCGGFVANYWGLGHPTIASYNPTGATGFKPRTIWGMNPSLRRNHPSAICINDAAIFFKDVKGNNPDIVAKQNADGSYDTSSGSQAFHIGLVSDVLWTPGTDSVQLEIAESSGAPAPSGGNGVKVRSLGQVEATVANNLVYCPDGANRIYFIGPSKAPQPYMPDTYGA